MQVGSPYRTVHSMDAPSVVGHARLIIVLQLLNDHVTQLFPHVVVAPELPQCSTQTLCDVIGAILLRHHGGAIHLCFRHCIVCFTVTVTKKCGVVQLPIARLRPFPDP